MTDREALHTVFKVQQALIALESLDRTADDEQSGCVGALAGILADLLAEAHITLGVQRYAQRYHGRRQEGTMNVHRPTKVTLRRYHGPTAGPQTYHVVTRTTGDHLGMVHLYPGNAVLAMPACWLALHGDGIAEFCVMSFRAAVAYAAGWGRPAETQASAA